MIDLTKHTMNITELSKLIGVHRNTIRNWVNKGIIPCFKVNHFTKFNPEEIQQFIKNNTNTLGSK